MKTSADLKYSTDAELLSYLIPKKKAEKVMERFSSVREVFREDYQTLKEVAGLTLREYKKLCVPGLLLERKTKGLIGQFIRQPEDVYAEYAWVQQETVESGWVLGLNTKNRVVFEGWISLGTVNAAIIEPRMVYHPAIKYLVPSIIFLHNHPSLDPTPSNEDIALTKKLVEAGKILSIAFLDHIIIGDGFYSLKEHSLI